MNPYIIAFTGHQPKHMDRYENAKAWREIEAFLRKQLELRPAEELRVLVGGARGVDTMAKDSCIMLGIPYTICIPHVGYRTYWEEAGIEDQYDVMLRVAPKVVFVVPETVPWSPAHNLKRNEYMVRWCDLLCAVYKGTIPDDVYKQKRGGTRHCIAAALKAGKPIYHIDPREER